MSTKSIILPILLTALLLSGCASKIMEGYVGSLLSDVVATYGPPTSSFDIDKDKKAFSWAMNSQYTTPGHSNTNGNINLYMSNIQFNQTTTYRPPTTYSQQCLYTIYATQIRDDITGPAAWRVTGFQKPRLDCE